MRLKVKLGHIYSNSVVVPMHVGEIASTIIQNAMIGLFVIIIMLNYQY